MKHTLKKIAVLSLSFVFAGGVVIGMNSWFNGPDSVNAGANHNFTGFAWSDMPTTSNEASNPTGGTVGRGAGWISFNSTDTNSSIDYGVNVDASGNISGYAWSEHVGWISFNNSAGCPTNNGTNCQPRIENVGGNKHFKGWARAMAYTDSQAGGWDGWISFSSTNHSGGLSYGWTLNTAGNVSGYAWGGDILGWIVPNNLKVNQSTPNLVLTANPSTITMTSINDLYTSLTYNSPNTPSGSPSPFSSCTLTTNPSSGSGGGTPVHGTVLNTATTLPVNAIRTISNTARVYAPTPNQTVYTLTCTPSAGGPNVVATATVTVTTPQAMATLTGPSCVPPTTPSAQLAWTSQNVSNCSISPSIGNLSNLNGSQTVSVGSTTNYVISCSGPYGNPTANHTITVSSQCQPCTPGTPHCTNSGWGIPVINEI